MAADHVFCIFLIFVVYLTTFSAIQDCIASNEGAITK
jgi:hypothetical protein